MCHDINKTPNVSVFQRDPQISAHHRPSVEQNKARVYVNGNCTQPGRAVHLQGQGLIALGAVQQGLGQNLPRKCRLEVPSLQVSQKPLRYKESHYSRFGDTENKTRLRSLNLVYEGSLLRDRAKVPL